MNILLSIEGRRSKQDKEAVVVEVGSWQLPVGSYQLAV